MTKEMLGLAELNGEVTPAWPARAFPGVPLAFACWFYPMHSLFSWASQFLGLGFPSLSNMSMGMMYKALGMTDTPESGVQSVARKQCGVGVGYALPRALGMPAH